MGNLLLPSALSGSALYLSGSLSTGVISFITARRIQIANLLDNKKNDSSPIGNVARRSVETGTDTLKAIGVGGLTSLVSPIISTGVGALIGYNIMQNRSKVHKLVGALLGAGAGSVAGAFGGVAAGVSYFAGKNLSRIADDKAEASELITGNNKVDGIGSALSQFDGHKELWKDNKERESMVNTFKVLLHKIHNISLEESVRTEALNQLRKVLPVHFSDINDDSIPMANYNGVKELLFISSKGLSNLKDKKENKGKPQYELMSLLKNIYMFHKEKEIQNKHLELIDGIPAWYSNPNIVNDVFENQKIENLIRPYLNQLPFYTLNKLVWTDEKFEMYKSEIIEMHGNTVDISKSAKELFDMLTPLEQDAILEDFKPSKIEIDEALLKLSFKDIFNNLDDPSKALVLYTINTEIEKADNELLNIIDKHISLLYKRMIDYKLVSEKLDKDHISNTERLAEEINNPKGIFGSIMSTIREKLGMVGMVGGGSFIGYQVFDEVRDFYKNVKQKGWIGAGKDKLFGNNPLPVPAT